LWRTDHIAIVKQLRVASAASPAPHRCQALKPTYDYLHGQLHFCGCIFVCTPSCSLWSLSRRRGVCRGRTPLMKRSYFCLFHGTTREKRHPDHVINLGCLNLFWTLSSCSAISQYYGCNKTSAIRCEFSSASTSHKLHGCKQITCGTSETNCPASSSRAGRQLTKKAKFLQLQNPPVMTPQNSPYKQPLSRTPPLSFSPSVKSCLLLARASLGASNSVSQDRNHGRLKGPRIPLAKAQGALNRNLLTGNFC